MLAASYNGYESDSEYPNHKFQVGDIVKTFFVCDQTYTYWLVEGISYDPVWYVWRYDYRVLETNETSHADIRAIDGDDHHTKVA